jgi:hypothetical protein
MDTLIGITGSSFALLGTFVLYLTIAVLTGRLVKAVFHGERGAEKT